MAEHNWAFGEALRAVDVDNVLEHQVVITTTSGARGATWLGKHVYLSDWDVRQYWDGARWKTVPNGIVTTQVGTGTGPGITTTLVGINGSQIIFTNVANEIYRYSWTFQMVAVSGGGGAVSDVYVVRPRSNGTVTDDQRDVPVLISNVNTPVTGWYDISWGAAASRTLDLSIIRALGTENGTIPIGGHFSVEHLGNL